MKLRDLPQICLALMLFVPEALAGTRQVLMPASGPSCRSETKHQIMNLTCAGPTGYFARFFDDGNLVGISFGRDGQLFVSDRSKVVWRGAGRGFGSIMEWRIDDAGRSVAAILRVWEIDDDERAVQSLKIFAINADSACIYAVVPAGIPNANERATLEATSALGWKCARYQEARP